MADLVALFPHVPGNVESFLDERAGPASTGVFLMKGGKVALLRVGPPARNTAQEEGVPPNLVLFENGLSRTPQVRAGDRGQLVAVFTPLAESGNDSLNNGGSSRQKDHLGV